ncbi:hypothetical protein [Bradyrhizobium sp. SZCCHNR2028]|uniref:hypothetical protein n=1 Tax=Bradyrhizobium sp. SZCCHNR2028 TaxID=3057382 RepID=UPI0028ECC51F|nr:hypothetical protein [Bradyrhizobium sp. SZCCHNR2028]
MAWIPGWDSIESAGWWSGFYFWLSIVSLIGLGAFEVASHRYGERRDELAEKQHIAEKLAHDTEIARLNLETARVQERASTAELDLAKLKLTAARVLTPAQQEELRLALASFGPIDAAVGVPIREQANPEIKPFAEQIALLLQSAGWGNGVLYSVQQETPVGVVVIPSLAENQRASDSIDLLLKALGTIEIAASKGRPTGQTGWGIEPSVRILIGRKL